MVKRSLCVAALAVLVTVPVFAKVVANATRTALFIGSGTFLMPLTDGGAVTLGFNGKGKHAIGYSAECTAAVPGFPFRLLSTAWPSRPLAELTMLSVLTSTVTEASMAG